MSMDFIMNFNNEDAFPNELIKLAKITKNDVFEKFGHEVFQKVVFDVLTGENVREFTEGLTRTRLLESNLALLSFYIEELGKGNLPSDIYMKAKDSLIEKNYKTKYKPAIEWLVMMTNKQTQNVLRDRHGDDFDRLTLRTQEQILTTTSDYKNNINSIVLNGYELSLEELSYILLSLGSQTLTIRGSEKSLHGKYFEKLILGALFSILGFRYESKLESNISDKCFTLSTRGDDRESDATIIYNGRMIRVDIGFIGRGNTEISLDKVSRFRKMDEIDGVKHHVNTMVIVDVIGEGSRISQMADKIDGSIFAMSNPVWVKETSSYISHKLGVEDVFYSAKDISSVHDIIKGRLGFVDLRKFIQL